MHLCKIENIFVRDLYVIENLKKVVKSMRVDLEKAKELTKSDYLFGSYNLLNAN